jgi:hypothetical protein
VVSEYKHEEHVADREIAHGAAATIATVLACDLPGPVCKYPCHSFVVVSLTPLSVAGEINSERNFQIAILSLNSNAE